MQQLSTRPDAVDGLGVPFESVEHPLEERWRAVLVTRAAEPAVVDDREALSYAELDNRSELVANRLRSLTAHAKQVEPVVVLAGHDRLVAVAAIALLKAAAPCLALDPAMPPARLVEIVRASGARVGVVAPAFRALADELGLSALVDLDAPAPAIPLPATRWSPRSIDDIQGITYTSGSTGAPKGVAVAHRTTGYEVAARARLDWCRADDRIGLVMPLTFGAARGELTAALMFGAAVHFYDPRSRGAGPLVPWLAEQRITVLAAPPSLLTAVRATFPEDRRLPASLRMVRSSGEKILCSDALAVFRALPPGCRLINAFGSTEATLITSYEVTEDVPDKPVPLPCGWPLPDRELRLEAEDGGEPAPGEKGELLVTARLLPVGYWRDAARTRARYTDLGDGVVELRTGDLAIRLPNGAYRLAGRKDLALKIRGNLVEPAEVESALVHIDGVGDAVVVGRPGRHGTDRLVAYLVASSGTAVLRSADIRRALRRQLPSYMVPEVIVHLPELPRTDRGKLDRAALPAPPERIAPEPEAEQTRTEWQDRVARTWQDTLGLDAIELDEDFFDLGGDSLAAEEMVTRLADTTGTLVASRLLLEASTLREFAAASAAPVEPAHPTLVPLRRNGSRPPLFCVAGAGSRGVTFVALARALGDDQPVYALQSRARDRRRPPEMSVPRMARRHVAAIRSVQPHGPYLLAGHSFGGVLAFEMATQLRASGEAVALLAPLDSFAPHPKALPPMQRRSAAEWVRTFRRLAVTTSGRQPDGQTTDYVRQSSLVARFYRGKPYGGRTLVLMAADDSAELRRRRTAPWRGLLSGVWAVEAVPGGHLSMLREPHVRVLAERLRTAMDEALASA